MSDNAGIRTIGRAMRRLTGDKAMTVGDVAQECGVARSTAFVAVRRLENAGFVGRDRGGQLCVGHRAITLGFSRFGLGPLHGPAEAIVSWLRNEIGGTSAFGILDVDGFFPLCIAGDHRDLCEQACLRENVHDQNGHVVAALQLALPGTASNADRAHATLCIRKAATTLTHHLILAAQRDL